MNSRQMSSTRRGARSIGEPNLFMAIGVQGLLAVKSSLDRAASQLFLFFFREVGPVDQSGRCKTDQNLSLTV